MISRFNAFCGIQIVAKGLFDHNAPPAPIRLRGQPGFPQLLDDGRKKPGRYRQVEKIIAFRVALGVHCVEAIPEFRECVCVPEIAALVIEPLPEPLQVVSFLVSGRQERSDLVAKIFDTQVIDRNSHDSEIVGKQFGSHQVEKRWNQLAFG